MSYDFQDIIKMYNVYRKSVYAVLAFLVVALISLFVNRSLTFILVACALIFRLFVSRRLQKRYVSMVNAANILNTICRLAGSDTVSEKDGGLITRETIISSELMTCGFKKSVPFLCWGVSGCIKGMPVALCDATIPQSFHLAEKGIDRVHFSSGVWTHVSLPGDTGLNIRLLDVAAVPEPVRTEFFKQHHQYRTAPLYDRELAEKFILYRHAESNSEIPEGFLRKLRKLVGYTTGNAAISICHDHMDVFIRGRFLAMTVDVSKAPQESALEMDPFKELSLIMDMAAALVRDALPKQLEMRDS